MLLRHGGVYRDRRAVEVCKPRVVRRGAVHGLRAQSHHQPQHARLRVHVRIPLIRAVAVPHAGGAGHEVAAPVAAGYPLHQYGHLLVPPVQPAAEPVLQRGGVHGAGVHRAHGVLERLQPLLLGAPVHAEHRLILAREGVAEAVLQEAGGPDDEGVLPEVFQHLAELLADLVGELAGQQPRLELVRRGEVAVGRALAYPQPPTAVGDDVGIEHIRADVEGIVGLAVGSVLVDLRLRDLPRQQHAAGLAADGAAADHAVPEQEVVRRREIGLDQPLEVFVLGHGAVDDLLLHLRRELPRGIRRSCHVEEPVVAVDVLVLVLLADLLDRLIVPADADAVVDQLEFAGAPAVAVGHEHGVRVAPPHLQRVEVDPFPVGAHVQQKLGRLPDAGDGVEGMPAPQHGEVGHRVQLEQVRAGDAEEVAHHQVGVPHRLKLRQAVEHVEGVPARAGDLVVDGHGEGLEARVRIELHHLNAGQVVQYRRMLGEADVEYVPPVLLRLLDERHGEKPEFVDV